MQELVGKLDVLDPGASHSLKVIAYFDALVEGHASAEMLVRGAAFLSGVTAGLSSERAHVAVGAGGLRLDPRSREAAWPTHSLPGGGEVWIERSGAKHANDDMILERLAIGIGITLERSAPHAATRATIETLIDPAESVEARQRAAVRLALDPLGRYVVVAVPASEPHAAGHHAIVVTPVGTVRALIRRADDAVTEARAGVGLATSAGALDGSWTSALTALRLTGPADPVIRADGLGALLLLAGAADAHAGDIPDLAALTTTLARSSRTLATLDAVARADSLRAAAASLGLHHSTLQAHAIELSESLGFDIRTPAGRMRLSLVLALNTFLASRFD